MSTKIRTGLIMLFVVLFVGSFGYLFLKQRLSPSNTNTQWNANTNNSNTNGSPIGAAGSPHRFESYDEFKKFIAANLGSGASIGFGGGLAMRNLAGETAPTAAIDFPSDFAGFSDQGTKSEDSAIQGPDYSQTNIQVEGVDEADIVKSDGKYLYVVSRNNLHIIEATPASEAKIISTVSFKDYPQELYISADRTRLVVYGSENRVYAYDTSLRMMPPYYGSQQTFLKVYDITDKAQPKEVRSLSYEGYASQSRMVGDHVYFITSKSEYNWYDGPYPLPRILNNGKPIGGEPTDASYRFPDVYYFPIPYENSNITTVSAIDVMDAAAEPTLQHYMLDANQQLYVSPNNIYITYVKHIDDQEIQYEVMKVVFLALLPAETRAQVSEIEAVPNYILSKYERRAKIMNIFQRHLASLPEAEQKTLQQQFENSIRQRYQEIADTYEVTQIHKIGYQDGVLTYLGNGSVPGTVINQFAMDESDGYFRIATTKNPMWIPYADTQEAQKSYNNLYVLDPELRRVGAVERLAEGERIYSVRFMQGRAYMVTFEQVDPLFVIDLSEPTNPRVLGQLKVPGFSNYLHPLDETTLIGLGKETQTNEYGSVIPKGIKISLFDVADVANPKEAATYAFQTDYSDSSALYDHKAFLFSGSKDLLVIPLQVWSAGPNAPRELTDNFNGAAVFTVTKSSITLKGFVKHGVTEQNGYSYDSSVKRSLYIDDVLYTLSDGFVKANALGDLAEIKAIAFPNEVLQPQPMPVEPDGGIGTTPGSSGGSAGAAVQKTPPAPRPPLE